MEDALSGSSMSINSLASTSTGTFKTNHNRLMLTKSLCTNSTSLLSVTSTLEILDEKPIIPSIQLRASTLERLIERCVECFDPNTGALLYGNEYVHVLLMMHKWIMNSHDFANRFLRLYESTMHNSLVAKQPGSNSKRASDAPQGAACSCSCEGVCRCQGNGQCDGGAQAAPGTGVPPQQQQQQQQQQPHPALLTTSPSLTSSCGLLQSPGRQAAEGCDGLNSLVSSASSSELVTQKAPRSLKLALLNSYESDAASAASAAASSERCSLLNASYERCSSNEREHEHDRECSSISISPESSSGVHPESDVPHCNNNCDFFQSTTSTSYTRPVDEATRRRVYQICFAVKYWITKMPVHFDNDDALTNSLTDFTDRLKTDGFVDMSNLLDTCEVPNFDWMRMISVRCPARHMPNGRTGLNSRKTSRGAPVPTTGSEDNKVALVFNKLKPEVIADQLTVLEYKAFRRIPFHDFKQYATTSSLDRCQRLERSIVLFNGLTQWVECMILNRTTPQERAEVISKFIEIAKRLYHLQNFNSLMAVVGGICHSAISRLGRTFACLDAEMHKVLTTFSDFLSSSSNYSAYRRHLAQCREFRIPILGVHLKDLICTHIAMSDFVQVEQTDPSVSSSCSNIAAADGCSSGSTVNLINLRKLVQLSMIFDELMQIQVAASPVEENTDLCNMLKLSLDMSYSEEEIYELSLAREPRNSLTNMSASVKPVPFAEFVAGIRPPDPETVNKHVRDMVVAVFKVYDHDKDGFISQEEFEDITQNFPFIDAFCVLDTDNDGVISRNEMLAYFIKGNSRLLRSSFKHNFHETTYFRPTYCAHCNGLLWGIIKQGWKCRDCGINSHRHCKDQIVCECRQRSSSVGANASPALLEKESSKRVHSRASVTASVESSTIHCSVQDDAVCSIGLGHEKAELNKPIATSNGTRRHQNSASASGNSGERSGSKSVRRRHTIHTCQGTQTDDVILEETLHEMNEQFEFEQNEAATVVNGSAGTQTQTQTLECTATQRAAPKSTHTPRYNMSPVVPSRIARGGIRADTDVSLGRLSTAVNRGNYSPSISDTPQTSTGNSSNELLFTHNSIARTSSTSSIAASSKSPGANGAGEVARSASACCPSTLERKGPLRAKNRQLKVEDRGPLRTQKSRVKFAQVNNSISSADSTGSTNSLASVTSTSDTTTNVSNSSCQLVSFATVATQIPIRCSSIAVGTQDDDTNANKPSAYCSTRNVESADRPLAMQDTATSPQTGAPIELDSPFYESAAEQYRRLLKAEAENEQLELENAQLRLLLRTSQEQLQVMRAQMNNVRHHTIEFILHQMDVLRVQRDSEV